MATNPLDLLTPAERACVERLAMQRQLNEGEVLAEEGSVGGTFWIVVSGTIEVLQKGQVLAQLGAGNLLGEMSLFQSGAKRVARLTATSPSVVAEIDNTEFWKLVLHHDPGATKLMQVLGQIMVERLQAQDAQLLRQAAENADSAAPLGQFQELKQTLLSDWALRYHQLGKPGKLSVNSTKPSSTAAALSVAYSPGVAEPCIEIAKDPDAAYDYTGKGHLVGVISNGTAVLGLGHIGALASKPVMEGKAVLLKRFADVDAFDIEVDELDPERLIDIVCAIAPTFGGINLEDIRAPECFHIERECQRRLNIPVFHDDQHGTAIVAGAALINAAELIGKDLAELKIVFSGAGAAGFTAAKYFVTLGARKENVIMTDVAGVIYEGRGDDNYLDEIAVPTSARTLTEVIEGADVFVGLSVGGVLKPQMLRSMARDPLVFALANPVPEIDPRLARETRDDVIMGTGRSDYPNQINNVVAFPYIFRGALDVRATQINTAMKIAATRAIADLARQPITGAAGFDGADLSFGREYLLPKPFDRRLFEAVSVAVAEAAIRGGVARANLDMGDYRSRMQSTGAPPRSEAVTVIQPGG